MEDKDKKIIATIGAIAIAIAVGTGKLIRKNGQKKLQKKVDNTVPVPKITTLSVDPSQIKIKKIDNNDIDWNCYQEISMSKDEIDMWTSFASNYFGRSAQIGMDVSAVNGLLKCDVPLNELYKIKDNPEVMRGYVMKDGKFDRQAKFQEAGMENVAPLMVYQCMAFVTSQYYQQVITEQLEEINGKLDKIIQHFSADDRAKLKIAYNRFVELQKKTTYDLADKTNATNFLDCVELIRERNSNLLFKIKDLKIDSELTDEKEAQSKIQKLHDSGYFEYLDLAIQAEVLTYIAYAVLIKIAKNLGNEEDVEIYMANLNINFWDKYATQFDNVKHDVIKYLELQSESSWFKTKSITDMKNEQMKIFNNIEADMLKRQELLNKTFVQYIEVKDDGTIRKFIPKLAEA